MKNADFSGAITETSVCCGKRKKQTNQILVSGWRVYSKTLKLNQNKQHQQMFWSTLRHFFVSHMTGSRILKNYAVSYLDINQSFIWYLFQC